MYSTAIKVVSSLAVVWATRLGCIHGGTGGREINDEVNAGLPPAYFCLKDKPLAPSRRIITHHQVHQHLLSTRKKNERSVRKT